MDKGRIKSFAVWARRSLISSVKDKAEWLGIYSDKIIDSRAVQGGFILDGREEVFNYPVAHRNALVKQVKEKGFEQVIEEVAYTWFNRFMGLRYMEVNDYLPSGIRILSSEIEGKTEPDVLSRISETVEELDLNSDEIYKLIDSGEVIDREKAYRIILVKQCNDLGRIIPQMFSKISDYTELLLPDNLLQEGSIVRRMAEDISEEDWKEEVEIIGWMYQYYISEKKDEVFAALKKNVKITKENIPAATQLFTPKWIVKYMVENSLGRLWLEGHPNEELQEGWKYYLVEADQEPEVEEELQKIREEHSRLTPEDIKILDPCMGSGHILVYAFDVLYEIYKSAGYSEREIPRLILQNNLYGLDIDDRAAQLASFALIMKARHYNRRLFREIERQNIELNLCSIQESNDISEEAINYFVGDNKELKTALEYIIEVYTDAKEYGSILQVNPISFELIKMRLKELEEDNNLMFADYRNLIIQVIPSLIKQAEIMSMKYEACVTNPPYMGRKGMSNKLYNYIDKKYNLSKNDMFSVMFERCLLLTKYKGQLGVINQHSWMFLSSFKELRYYICNETNIQNMIHLGTRAFKEIGGEVVQTTTLTLRKYNIKDYLSRFIRCVDINESKQKELYVLRLISDNGLEIYNTKIDKLATVPGCPIAYWISDNFLNLFSLNEKIRSIGMLKSGTSTSGDNDRLFRLWHEVDCERIESQATNYNQVREKWVRMNKGGSYRKWYGNLEYVADKSFCPKNENEFSIAITWSDINTRKFCARLHPEGIIANNVGKRLYLNKEDFYYGLGFLNSVISDEMLKLIIPTIHYDIGYVGNLPYIKSNDNMMLLINELVKANIQLAKLDWDSYETSWDFSKHPFLKDNKEIKIENSFKIWEKASYGFFSELKSNEEELNRIFISIYGLENELTTVVQDKDVTIRRADRSHDIKSFISYAVGCILGRYSIDTEGLIYAGGSFEDKWNFSEQMVRKIEKDEEGNILSDSWVQATFLPDEDNIIPITEEEYFEDDIVSRFIEFVRVTFSPDTLEENLDYIADSIGRKGNETSRQAIRRYFVKDFYTDHLKTYQKRPIYWLFDSGKNDGFKALIYMHRYDNQTLAKVRTKYSLPLQRKYEAEVLRQQQIVDSVQYSNREKAVSKKKIERLNKQIQEIKEYDQIVDYLANEKIDIDLDGGVKGNYAKFQDVKILNSKGKEIKINLLAKI